MQVNPVDLAASHQAMMKSLLFKPVPVPPSQLWEMVSNMGLSRDVSEPMNFGDGLLIAEIIHLHSSLLVPSPVLQKLELEARHYPNQRKVWDQLALTAFKQLCIQLTNELVSSFEVGNKQMITIFLTALIQQLDQHQRIQNVFNSFTRTSFGEYFQRLTAIRTFEGSPYLPYSKVPWLQGKTVIRLSNVDYHTKKYDVQKFLYPIIVDQSDVHIPIHLNTGKMMYTIFVVFDDQTTPVRAIDLHSGMSLLARRVDIRIVSIDELLVSFFSRGLETSTTFELSEWVHNETKEKFLKLCRYQRQRNGIIPDRTFEHILSYLQLLPFLQNVAFSLVEIERVFELSIVSLTTLIGHIKHDKLKASHLIDLLNRLFSACLAITIFNQDQTLYLESLYKEHLQNLNALLEPVNPPINSSNSNLFFPHSKNDFMTINENNTTSNLLTTSTSPDSLPSFSFFARSSPENLIPRSPTKLKSAQRSRNYITLDIGLFHYDFDPLDVLGKFLWEALQ